MKSNDHSDRGRLRVAAYQMKFDPTLEGNLGKMESAIHQASRRNADVILFPECATTGYAVDFSALKPAVIREAVRAVSAMARRHGMHVLFGTPLYRGRQRFNCLLALNREGRPHHCYAKCQLTPGDRKYFVPGNSIALFQIDGIPVTSVICHERRYPELVRLACMAGARILFHPNAGLDALAVSKRKRNGQDGIPARAFENAIFYVFANSVGPQGNHKWSAGDTKIISPRMKTLAYGGNTDEGLIMASLDLTEATGKYPAESMEHPAFLSKHWKRVVQELTARARCSLDGFDLPRERRHGLRLVS